MREIRKVLKLDRINYYKTHLSIINCILPEEMTPKEIEVLAHFMSLEGDIAKHRFGPSAKKIIMTQLSLTPAGLSNHIRNMIDRGFLIKEIDILSIFPILHPNKDQQEYLFRLVNSDYIEN